MSTGQPPLSLPTGPGFGTVGAEAGRVAFLNQALWRRLADAESPESFAAAWLALQCRIIDDATGGLVVLGPVEQGPFRPVAAIPEGETIPPRLLVTSERAIAERRGVVQASKDGAALAFPLIIEGKLFGVAGLEIGRNGAEHVRQRMRELQWGAQSLEYALYRTHVASALDTRTGLQRALELLASAVEEPHFETAAIALATELAERLGCERVALGFRSRGRIVVRALSHSAQFNKRMNLVRLIANAMDEAIDQVAIVLYPTPQDGEPQLDSAHRDLLGNTGATHILTVPFSSSERILGALLLERGDGRGFTAKDVETVEYVGAAVGPVLDEKRRNDRLLLFKITDSALMQAQRLFGPRYYGRKLAALGATAVIAFFAVATTTYRVTADAHLEGTVQRAVIAAFDGYVESEHVRAGDVVRAGDTLAQLDTRDLILEQARRIAEREELAAEHSRALANGDRAQVNILLQQMAQVGAQIDLLGQQVARATIQAPFDGIVVGGDLSQLVGAAVHRGDELFTIAPLDSYRVILRVDESEIANVAAGQSGTLRLASLPDDTLPIVVERLTPLAEARDGRTQFRVEAELTAVSDRLRPGMEGVGKIEIDERRVIWIWTRSLIDWLRLTVWRYWP